MASFPTSIVSPTDPTSSNFLSSPSHSQEHQSHNAEIVAIETKFGTGSSTPAANKILYATGTGTSAWQGLTSAQLLAILSDETGTGSAVFGTAPTLGSPIVTTPNIITSINDTNSNELFKVTATGSAVNEVTIANAATTTSPSLTATGGDTNIDLKLVGKGTGKAYPDSINEFAFDFVVSGLVWTGDSLGVTRAASMTAGIAYISGVRVTIAAVTARTFTASKDTYIDLSSSGTITYTEVSNNAASPALSANNIRIGIIITGATTIAGTGSINQGQETMVLPIASSIPYVVTDSLGNLICPRDPNRKLLGYSRLISPAFTTTTVSSVIDVTGLQTACIVPTGRKIKVRFAPTMKTTAATATAMSAYVRDGSNTVIAQDTINDPTSQYNTKVHAEQLITPSAGSHTYKASVDQNGAGTLTVQSGTGGGVTYMAVELFVELY